MQEANDEAASLTFGRSQISSARAASTHGSLLRTQDDFSEQVSGILEESACAHKCDWRYQGAKTLRRKRKLRRYLMSPPLLAENSPRELTVSQGLKKHARADGGGTGVVPWRKGSGRSPRTAPGALAHRPMCNLPADLDAVSATSTRATKA